MTGAVAFSRSRTILGTFCMKKLLAAAGYSRAATAYCFHLAGLILLPRGLWLLPSSQRTREMQVLAPGYGEYRPEDRERPLRGPLPPDGGTCLALPGLQQSACAMT